jgi:tRNA nucleotidyltransferase/poly(A) polymerase
MSLTFRPEVSSVLDLIQSCLEKDVDLYLVGGGIRDVLLGRKLQDLDFSMSSDPTSLARRVADRLKAGFFVLDDDRHTARVVYRTSDGGFFPLDFVQYTGESLTDDLYHRDFTINAMAISIRNRSEIIDPLDGQADLKVGRLDVCQPHALLDDPVRVLRGVRLAMQFDFSYAPGLEKLMREAALHLHKTSYERQRDEVFKILEGPHPAKGMQHFYQFGVFETLIPALMEQESIPASSPHVLPLFEHTLRVVEEYDQILKSLTSDDPQLISMNWWLSEVVCDLQLLAEELRTYFLEEITPGGFTA